jgi:hypothetical protein
VARLAVATSVLFLVVVPSIAARTPNQRGELTAASHGDRDWAALESSDWCPEGGDFCRSTILDYAVPERWDRLPIHPGGVMRLRTGKPARAVSVKFEGKRCAAKRRDDSGRRWRVRVPQSARGKTFLGIVADYRYRKDGEWWGGKYRFFLPVRQHRHD